MSDQLSRNGPCLARGASRISLRTALLICYLAALGPFGFGQTELWDHVGNGERDVRTTDFDELGDLNGDGVNDFITGSGAARSAFVRSGADGSLLKYFIFVSHNGFSTGYGRSVAGIGDFDGDQIPDYAVSAGSLSTATFGLGTGMVFVYSGKTDEVIVRIPGAIPGQAFGEQVLGLGDVNGDGYSDLGVGATYTDDFRIYLGPSGTFLRETVGGTHSAEGKARFGDHDGDGCDDYLIGERTDSSVAPNAGSVHLYSGRTGQRLLSMYGDKPERLAGFSVSRGGDWNGDGVEDVVAGAPGLDTLQYTAHNSGVYVFSGADGSILHFFDGEAYCQQNSGFGYSVSSGKDVNGDGVPDLIVGAPLQEWTPTSHPSYWMGEALVFSGATKQVLWRRRGTVPGEKSGTRVALIDDHNSDGLADWMVMGPFYDDGTSTGAYEQGRLTIFAGAIGDALTHCQGGVNSLGFEAQLKGIGPISLRENQFQLLLTDMPQARAALIVHQRELAPASPFGPGELCLKTPIGILGVVSTSTEVVPTDPGQATLAVDLGAAPFGSLSNPLQPGDSWAFQAVYRDQGERNASNALEVVFVP